MAATVGSLRVELSASVAQFQADLGKAADSFKDLSRQFTGVGNDFKKVGNQIQSIGLSLSKTVTLPLVGLSAAVTKVGIDFEDAFAGVEKTVGGVVDSLGKLTPAGQEIEQAFRDLAKTVPTSAAELAKIGETAGQLGVSKENIVAFTKTIADISTATHLSTEEAATSFAKLAVVMKIPQSQFESLGSAVYALGNFGSSTEQEMLGMAQRIASAGATVGLTAAQVLGLGNALASAGIEVEAGGTAMSKLIILMAKAANDGGKELKAFAKVAGESSDAFKKQFQTDPGSAIVAFVEGLGQIKAQGGNLLGTIEALGIKNSRLRDSTLSLANAGNLVAESFAIGTKAFGDHAAFLQAVQVRYQTTSNQLKILGNQITDVGITLFTALKPAIETAIRLVGSLLPLVDSLAKSFAGLPGGVQLAVISFLGLSAALGPLTYLGGQVITSMGTLVGAFGKTGVATRGIVGALSLGEKALGAFNSAVLVDGAVLFEWGKGTVAVGGLVGRLGTVLIELATTAFGPLAGVVEVVGAAFAAIVSPIGLVVAGVAALALGVIAATGHWSDFTAAVSAVVGVVKDAGTVLFFLAKGVIVDLVTGLADLAKWLGGAIVSGFQSLVSLVQALLTPFQDLATTIAGPVIAAFKEMVAWVKDNIPAWLIALILKIEGVAVATKDLAVEGAKNLHDYATAVRDAAKDIEQGFQQATKALDDYRQSVSDRAIPAAVMDIGKAFALLKSQLSGLTFGGSNGFQDLLDSLKAARAELAALSSGDLARLTEAVKSGAFSMKEIADATGLSDMALKLFQEQLREAAKEAKAANSIFAEFDKQQAQAITALTEGFSVAAPIEFIKKAFGSLIAEVVEKAGALGKQVPDIIKEGFLQITLKDAADHMVGELATFGKKLNDQVKADLDKRNDQIIKALGASVDAQQQAAEAASQFSIQGLANEIKNIETVYGETKKAVELKKQLYAEEYLFQVGLIEKQAQAQKDGLDKTEADYLGTFSRIDAATAAKIGLLAQDYQQKLTQMRLATKKWQDSLSEIASVFSDIASSSSGSFASVVKDIGNLVSAFDKAEKAAKAFKAASAADDTGGKVAAAGQGIAAVVQATSSKNVPLSVAGGALSGGITGATIGSIVPGIGTAIGFGVGATVGALVGLIRALHKGPAEKAALDVGRDFGINISDGLAKELADLGKVVGRQAANIFDLDKIIAEGGGLKSTNIQGLTKKLSDIFPLLHTGALSAADATHVLDSNFQNFADYFLSKGPLISKDLVDIVKQTHDWGLESKAVADFIAGQIDSNIIPGLARFTGASKTATDALADNQKKLADLKGQLADSNDPKEQASLRQQIASVTDEISKQQGVIAATAVTSQGAADALSASVLVAFNEMQKAGKPVLEIAAKLSPIVDQLGKQFDAAGFSGGAAFEKVRGLIALASDEIAGPAIDAATGLGQTLAGLSNIGALDQSTFTGLTDQIDATFQSLVSQGKDGGQVLALMKDPLQTIWELQEKFGFTVDDATQALLLQANAAGIVGEKQKPIQEQMLDATNKIADAVTGLATLFGVVLPDAGQTGADRLRDEFSRLHPQVNVDINYNDPGYTPPDVPGPTGASTGGFVTSMGIQHFAAGGRVGAFKSRGTDTVPAMLTPGEVVLTSAQQAAISASLSAVVPDLSGPTKFLQMLRDQLAGLPADAQIASNSIGGITAAMNTASSSGQVALQSLTGAMRTTLPGAVGKATDSIKGQFDQIQQLFAQGTPDSIKAGTDAATKLLGSLGADTSGNLDDMSKAIQNYLTLAMQDLQTQFGNLPDDAKTSADDISEALKQIKVPTIKIPVRIDDQTGGGGGIPPFVPGYRFGSAGITDFGSGTLAVLHGREAVVTEDQIAAMRSSVTVPVGSSQAADSIVVNVAIHATDATSFERLMTREGGGADVIIRSISQGKRGRDEKLRRALRVS